MIRIVRIAMYTLVAVTAALLVSCTSAPGKQAPMAAAPAQVAVSQPAMAWPEKPSLPCPARVGYATEFLKLMKQGMPEDRIHFSEDWPNRQELAEILEIRRRAFHDREALLEIVSCAEESFI
ncbi:MAG: hypothetical protein ABI612_15275 [Betaproteobacteria bacterium]